MNSLKKLILGLLAVSVLCTAPASAVCFLSPQTTARARFVELKRKVNNFVEEHKTAFIIGGTILAAAAVIVLGAVAYKMIKPGAKPAIDPQALLPRVDGAGGAAVQAVLTNTAPVTTSVAKSVASTVAPTVATTVVNNAGTGSVAQTVAGAASSVSQATSDATSFVVNLQPQMPYSGRGLEAAQLLFMRSQFGLVPRYANSNIATEN